MSDLCSGGHSSSVRDSVAADTGGEGQSEQHTVIQRSGR